MRIPTFSQFHFNSDLISRNENQLNQIIAKMSEGKKILASSENPVLGSKIKTQRNVIQNLESYDNNCILAQNRTQLYENTISDSMNAVNDIQTLILKARGGLLSLQDRKNIASQLGANLSILMNNANKTDADGSYIFSGYNSNTIPFVQSGNTYQYQGSLNQSHIQIADNMNSLYFENGFEVFANIYNGNGSFTIDAGTNNTGTASTIPGSVSNQANYVADTYTLTFVTNSNGDLAYQVIGANSGQVVPPPPATIPANAPAYIPKADISFNGVTFTADGAPKVGDTFIVQPSKQQNVFDTLQQVINQLQSPTINQGQYDQALSQASAAFGQISAHLINYQSQIGVQANVIKDQMSANDKLLVNAKAMLSSIEDKPLEQSISELAQKNLALQAMTESFTKLQEILNKILRI